MIEMPLPLFDGRAGARASFGDPVVDDAPLASAALTGAPLPGSVPGTPPFQVRHADAIALLESLPSTSVDLLVTDPAYESLEKHRAIGTTTRLKHSKSSSNDWFTIFPNRRFPDFFREAYRVLKKNTHLYVFSDQETMFVIKPIAEAAGFKFWKPLVWDKCLAPETPVWTERGVRPIQDVLVGDRVATPSGTFVSVLAKRNTRSPAVRIALSDGTNVIASREHRFILSDGTEIEAEQLRAGSKLATAPIAGTACGNHLRLDEIIDAEDLIYELQDTSRCLFCGQELGNVRAAATHQARFCAKARSKAEMANEIGVAPERLRRWLSDGRIPAAWASALGLEEYLTSRVRMYLQNDAEHRYPESIRLDYGLGRFVGLFAAEGSWCANGVTFACHRDEKHLQAHLARTVRRLGVKALLRDTGGNGCSVDVHYKIVTQLLRQFVGGDDAVSKHLLPAVYRAPAEFREGVFDGILEGDGHWSHDEQRETLNIASQDLAQFIHRHARERGFASTVRRFENSGHGGWKVRFDPAKASEPLTVKSVEDAGVLDLVDIAIDDPLQLFVLANGLVSHNCTIGMGYHYRSRYELILFFEKGKRKLHDLGVADIIEERRIRGGYPSEKPPRVSEVLIKQSSEPGALVVDPFSGSASVGVAALRNGRRYLGGDICEEAVEVARERLEAVLHPPADPPVEAASAAQGGPKKT